MEGEGGAERPARKLALARLGDHRLVGPHTLAVERRQHQLASAHVLVAGEEEDRAPAEKRLEGEIAAGGDRVDPIRAEQPLQGVRVGEDDDLAGGHEVGAEGVAVAAPAVLGELDRAHEHADGLDGRRARRAGRH